MAAADDAYKKALSQLDELVNKQTAAKKSLDDIQNSWSQISNEVFKVSGADWFTEVPKSAKDLEEVRKQILDIRVATEGAAADFSKLFDSKKIESFLGKIEAITPEYSKHTERLKDQLKVTNDIATRNNLDAEIRDREIKQNKMLTDALLDIKKTHKELSILSDEDLKGLIQQVSQTEILENGTKNWQKILLTATDSQRQSLALMVDNSDNALKLARNITAAQQAESDLTKSAGESTKQFNLLGGITKRMQQGMVDRFFEVDEIVHKFQKDTGVMFTQNSIQFAELTSKSAAFGMSVEETAGFMGDLSQELQTTDFGVLAHAADELKAVQGATGAVMTDITGIAGEMMRLGESSERVRDFMEDTSKSAQMFGVSSKKALADINRNITKMRTMGFTEGEDSLKRMVIQANKMRMNVDEIFNTAKMARTVEGATDMAAQLQLAGGSFAQINPMQLLSAARKGPEEMQKILAQMGTDIGQFNKDGKFQINPIDADRLQIVSEATGQSVENLTNMITANAEKAQKIDPFKGYLSGIKGADKELAESGLSDMLEMGKDGKLTIKADAADFASKAGIKNLGDINDKTIQEMIKNKKADAVTLDAQNAQNQSLKKSFDNLINSFMNILTVFEPLLSGLAKVMSTVGQWFSGFGAMGKIITSAIMFGGLGFMSKFMLSGKVTSIFGKFMNKIPGFGSKGISEAGGEAGGKGSGGFLKGFAEGLKKLGSITMKEALMAGFALLTVGTAIAAFIGELNLVGGIKSISELASAAGAMVILGGGVWLMSKILGKVNVGNVVQGALAMAILGASMIPFALAAQMFQKVDWETFAKMGVVMLGGILSLMAIGAIMETGVGAVALLAGALALVLVGAALAIFAASMLLAADGFDRLAKVNWEGFSAMGPALLGAVPGLLGFAFAALAFANPLTLISMALMVGTLGAVAAVLQPLSESLTVGADSLSRFVDGLKNLGDAADKLNLDKLDKLKDLSDKLANLPAANVAALASMANAANGGGGVGGGGGTLKVDPITINIKMNGRDMQQEITTATAILK